MIPPERDDCGQENLLSKRSFRNRILQRRFKDLNLNVQRRLKNNLATSTPLNHARGIPEPTFGGMSWEYHSRLFATPCSSFKEASRSEDSGVGVSVHDSSSDDVDCESCNPDRFQSLFCTSLVPQQYDFLKEFTKIGGYEVTSQLLSYLSPKDLQAVSSVSRHYRNIVLNDIQANRRRCTYLIDARLDQEKGYKHVVKSKETNEDRVLFQDLANKLPTIPKQPLENQNSKMIYDSFVEVGKKIHRSELLMKCPSCRYPAQRVNGSRYCCTRQFCLYEFCRDCLGTYVDNHQCQKFQKVEETSKIIVGSKRSKSNLRRL